MTTAALLDQFSRELDKIEKHVPMTGSFQRIDPYVIHITAAPVAFDLIVYHVESQIWYNTDRSRHVTHDIRTISQNLLPRPGEVAFDLGSNAGFYSLAFARIVGPAGEIHAFDPFPWNAAAVRFNARLNGLLNVHMHQVGIGGTRRRVKIAYNDARIYTRSRDGFGIDIVPLDDYAHFAPAFLKIDIEGAERELVRGAVRTLAWRPRIYLELHVRMIEESGQQAAAVLADLQGQGYTSQVGTDDNPAPWAGEPVTTPDHVV